MTGGVRSVIAYAKGAYYFADTPDLHVRGVVEHNAQCNEPARYHRVRVNIVDVLDPRVTQFVVSNKVRYLESMKYTGVLRVPTANPYIRVGKLHYRRGVLHTTGDPSTCNGGRKFWTYRGRVSRENGPAVIARSSFLWVRNGVVHRRHGPAWIKLSHNVLEWAYVRRGLPREYFCVVMVDRPEERVSGIFLHGPDKGTALRTCSMTDTVRDTVFEIRRVFRGQLQMDEKKEYCGKRFNANLQERLDALRGRLL